MNLAFRDIRHRPARFVLSCIGVGILLTLVLTYSGIYHGFVHEALAIIDNTRADVWVVQRDTRGPFAEQSRLPEDIRYRLAIVPGVAVASPYMFYTIQREWQGRPLRFGVVGYDLHTGIGGPRNLIAGRGIGQAHYEMVADAKMKVPLGSTIHLGLNDYTVVGLTKGIVGVGGDPIAFFSLTDAQEIQFVKDNWTIRNSRERAETAYNHALPTQPTLSDKLAAEFADNLDVHTVNAVALRLLPGADSKAVAQQIEQWKHYSAYTTGQQTDLLLAGSVALAKRQTGMFRIVLTITATVIIAQIIFTMTLEKLKPIAVLKLIGAQKRLIASLVLQESLALGLIAYLVALLIGSKTYGMWPRLVLVETGDKISLLVIVVIVSIVASLVGIRRALQVEPGEALGG
jgi:putative ABC transport system permease protein